MASIEKKIMEGEKKPTGLRSKTMFLLRSYC